MSVTDWSVAPDANAVADPTIPARDGASARQVPELVRGVMAKVAAFAADQGGALVTAGTANAYAVTTTSASRSCGRACASRSGPTGTTPLRRR